MRARFGDFELDDKRVRLTGPDGPVHVEPQVFELLRHLILNRDRVVAKEELLDAVWGDRFVSESALTTRIKAARRAVGDDGRGQRVIRTVHGRGYQFVTDVLIAAGTGRRSLPRLRSRPIGRDHDITRVGEQLSDAPLVTVTGPGGIGKTTVAVAAADRVQDRYPDGVVFVDLAPVPPQAAVTRAVAEASGVEGGAAATLEGVADNLARRPVLLVLDNCEHVLGPAAELVDRVLALGDMAHVLATSREPLGVAGEHLWPLGPLHDEGPVLFVERARAAEPRVAWDPADPAVVDLCHRLDDVPLAIELAAGQLRSFGLDELTRRLDDRLALLSRRAAGPALRHATMETAVDWSYRLLDDGERCLLRHLSVFPSSFDLQAVEGSAPPLAGADPVAVLGHLVAKSLVVHLPGSGRYRMLEAIRVFGRNRLVDAGETEAALERHRRHVRDRVAAASRLDRWFSARLGTAFRASLDDARQAFHLSLEQGRHEDAVEIAVGASFLWRNAIGCAEGNDWTAALLQRDLSPRDRLWAAVLRADVGQGRGDPGQMFGVGAAASGRVEVTGDAAAACLAAHYGALAHLTEPDRAHDPLASAHDLAIQAGDTRLVTLVDVFRAVADLAAGHLDDVRTALARIDRGASDDGYERFLLHWAGWMLGLAEQDAATARGWMSRQQDYLDRTGIVETWITRLSSAMCDVLDGGDVRGSLGRTLTLAAREGWHAEADCVLVLAYGAICTGRLEAAAELVGTAVHGRFNATALYVMYRAVLDRILRQRLDGAVADEAMARGRARSAADALAAHHIAAA